MSKITKSTAKKVCRQYLSIEGVSVKIDSSIIECRSDDYGNYLAAKKGADAICAALKCRMVIVSERIMIYYKEQTPSYMCDLVTANMD